MTSSVCNNALAANVEYGHSVGWSFTPLGGKRPVLKGWQSAPRESLEQALEWAAHGNVGLRTGQVSGLVAIDVDEGGDLEGLELPATVTVNTGGNGMHLYYRCGVPLGNSSGRLGPHIDVRADGGQVVFPGSVHPDTGRTYEWAKGMSPWETKLAELPEHVIELLKAPPMPTPTRAPASAPPRAPCRAKTQQQRYAAMALRLELNAVYTAREGERNDALNKAAFSLGTLIGGGYLDRTEVEEALRGAARAVGLEPRETEATIRSGIESGIKEPRVIPDKPAPAKLPPKADAPVSDDDIPALPQGQFKLDLYGNADRFMHLFGRDVHWCEERGKWFVWDGRCWAPDALREVSRMAEITMRALAREARGDEDTGKWAARCNKAGTAARETLDVVKHRTAIALGEFDRQPWLLGVQNGVVDLRTGELLEHDREYLITVLSPTHYDPDARGERWERFLREVMNGDESMVAALQRMAGYFLTGDISVQVLPIFYGPGGNGKNVFLDTLMGVMGPYAAEAPEGLITTRQHDEHPTEIADLAGKRLVVASENEEGRKMRVGLVKKLTGNKYLKARFMRQDYFQFERTHKTVLVTNNRPIISETSNAVWRRLRLIPFTVTIPEERQDRQLTEKLVAEWPGILAWAVRGCLDWQARQCDLELPDVVQTATREYRDDSDPVGQFVEERCVVMDGVKVSRSSLYQAYEDWARKAGEEVLSGKAFTARMRARGLGDSAWTTEHGKRTRAWSGIALAGPAEEVPGAW